VANNLSRYKEVAVVAERCSIRSIERMTGIHRGTIMCLA
jgi:hypothetical protein